MDKQKRTAILLWVFTILLLAVIALLLWRTGFFQAIASEDTLAARPWGLLVACAFGGSALDIPIWAMALIGLAGLALFLVSMKYGDHWEARLLEKFKQ